MSETIIKYRVICDSLAYRKKPTLKGEIEGYLHKGDKVSIVKNWTKSMDRILWLKLKSNDKYFYISSKYLERVTPNYLARVSVNADVVYEEIIALGCGHGSGSTKHSHLRKKRVTTCASAVSIVLQLSGMMDEGKLISHTEAVGDSVAVKKKLTIPKAMSGRKNLNDGTYTMKRIGKRFDSVSAEYKKKGVIYVYDSNIAIYAGGNKIYSCNNGQSQLKDGKYVKNKMSTGYCFTSPILYAIVPND